MDIVPFKLCDNLYFVGGKKVSVHIIKTSVGLVMIDTGYPDMFEQIVENMRAVYLEPTDICAIFHSHGHVDHYGCTTRFQAISGAKTYISRIDNDIVNGTLPLSWAKELGLPAPQPFDCDVLIEDGDSFTFGDTTIRCVLTPGHTAGVLSFFVGVRDNGKTVIAAMHGGIGMNSMRADFLNEYGLSFDCRESFKTGLSKVRHEQVDIVMGNHPGQSDTEGKQKRLQNGVESIVDPMEWTRLLDSAERNLDALLESEKG